MPIGDLLELLWRSSGGFALAKNFIKEIGRSLGDSKWKCSSLDAMVKTSPQSAQWSSPWSSCFLSHIFFCHAFRMVFTSSFSIVLAWSVRSSSIPDPVSFSLPLSLFPKHRMLSELQDSNKNQENADFWAKSIRWAIIYISNISSVLPFRWLLHWSVSNPLDWIQWIPMRPTFWWRSNGLLS